VDQFALLILDIRMPGITGIELAHMIKDRKKTAQIPIIFLTAYYNEDQHVLEGYGAGAVDYLQKPVNADILRSKVAVFAELYRMQQEIRVTNGNLLAEVSERRRAQEELSELNNTLEQRVAERARAAQASAALLQTATDNASVGLVTLDRDLRYTFANPAYRKIFGVTDEIIGKHASQLPAPAFEEKIAPLLHKALEGERSLSELNLPLLDSTGRSRHYSVVCEPERDAEGLVAGVVVVVFDVSDRKRNEEQIRLLLSEVNHRCKNLLSVVSAIARQTSAHAHADFVQRFSDRIHALSASHDLLAKSQWQRISVSELVRAQLSHFEDLVGQRIMLRGPPVSLGAAGAQCIGMVIHELATNAAKHGALSNQAGRIDIAWQLRTEPDGDRFAMSWVERGGPPVVPSSHRGYGSTVIKTMAELSLQGQVQLSLPPSGLSWQLTCPTARILEHPEIASLNSPAGPP
jgi:PAS domain S-box-containing protein